MENRAGVVGAEETSSSWHRNIGSPSSGMMLLAPPNQIPERDVALHLFRELYHEIPEAADSAGVGMKMYVVGSFQTPSSAEKRFYEEAASQPDST